MDPDDDAIFETVLQVVTRYGMKRTTMAELARGAGVSRQTLYDRFGDKDGIMAAVIENAAARLFEDLRTAFGTEADLGTKLDAYFNIAVWPFFEILQTMPDAADFENGMGPASASASKTVEQGKAALLAEMLADHLPPNGQSPSDVASFIESSSSRAKHTITVAEDLARFLAVLKASTLALTKVG